MKRLIPEPHPFLVGYEHLDEHLEDIERLVKSAVKAGYQLTQRDAAELWRRHSDDVCASWLALDIDSDDQTLVTYLLKHAVVTPAEGAVPPPEGFPSWLDYAVATMDTRSEELTRMFDDDADGSLPTRAAMRDAARAELDLLRRQVGLQEN